MVTLKEGKILESWSLLIEHAQEEEEGFFRAVETNLEAAQAPGVSWKRESTAPGWIKGLFGKRRDFLLVTHERFDDYMVAVGARAYGTFLDVTWFWSGSTKSAIVNTLGKIPGVAGGVNAYILMYYNLDVFDQQDLTSYVGIANWAARKATDEIMAKHNLDRSRIDWKSRGMVAAS